MKRLVLMMTLLAWGMSEDVVPPKEVEAGDKPPKYWEKDMHPTPSIYDGDWSKGAPKEFIGKPQLSVPKQIHIEVTKEKENVKNWTVLNPDPGKEAKDGFYRLLGSVIIDDKDVAYWRVYTIKGGFWTGWFLEYWKETGVLKQKFFAVKDKAEGWSYEYHPNGQLAEKYWFKNGKAEGWVYYYYPDGVLKEKYYSTNREINGKHFVFYPTGELEKETDRVGGHADGWEITYYKNGKVHFKAHFHEGFEDGDVETFKEDGTPSGKLPIGKMLDRGAIKKK